MENYFLKNFSVGMQGLHPLKNDINEYKPLPLESSSDAFYLALKASLSASVAGRF